MKKNRFTLNPKNWSIWLVIKDIQNYIDWIKTINREKAKPNSIWNKYNMNHNIFYTVYLPVVLPEEDRALPDNIKRLRVVEFLAPVHRYFDEELQFAEYIVPEFNQFYDENNNPTLVYGIVYRFAFKRLSLNWIISRIIFIGGLIWAITKFSLIQKLITLISSL